MKLFFKMLCVILLLPLFSEAQDFHYSMFTMAPLTLNPALTGNFTGDLRIVNNYRTQWSNISKPYTTYSFGGDMPLPKKDKKKSSPDFFAVGLNVNVDKAGSTSLKNNQFSGSFSYNKSLDGAGATFFSMGFMAGMDQRSINLGSSTWNQQFDGLNYDPTLGSGETALPNDHYLFGDYAAGIAITTVRNDRFKMNGGAAVSHLSRPEVQFLGGTDKLYMKLCAHYSAQIALGENANTTLIPQFEYVQQGPAKMINAGAGVKFKMQDRSHYTGYQNDRSFTLGGMYRLGDAVSAYVRVDIGAIGAAINYDLNVSKLTAASNGRGAMEFMLIYTGLYSSQNTRLSKPSFF
ncbi:MAG: PorP/SprF family type IX secretion system membrane protein [Bacteroidetes bacterium]|nr:PorP/SprF family type IX secretion system membrane protein [Bacteroidota bacterium]